MSEPATVVLVHGAWHGAWCWARVVARAVLPALQRNLAARCDDIVEIAASHSPFESRPDELTAVLVDLATRAGA